MQKIKRFEDLIAWQKARVLTQEIYRMTQQRPFSQDRALCSQIRRAAISVMSNIAEGYERRGPKEFRHFLRIAKASCAEVRSQLYIANDIGYIDAKRFTYVMEMTDETGKILAGLIRSINVEG